LVGQVLAGVEQGAVGFDEGFVVKLPKPAIKFAGAGGPSSVGGFSGVKHDSPLFPEK